MWTKFSQIVKSINIKLFSMKKYIIFVVNFRIARNFDDKETIIF